MSLTKAVSAVRAKCLVAVKTSRNTGINSDYASYADVMAVLGPALNEAGVAVGFLPSTVRKEGDVWIQVLIMEISHEEEKVAVSFETVWPEGNRGVNATQRQGMAHTYGKRYALVDYFHMLTGDDDDAARLGHASRESVAMMAREDAHWSQFCYVPALGAGTEETAGTWAALADPTDETGQRTLGDLSEAAIGKMWMQGVRSVGIDGWMAEVVGHRAAAQNITSWSELVSQFLKLGLPELFEQCSSEQLNVVARNLKAKGGA